MGRRFYVNYYSARVREDGKWDYTCQNDNRVWPVGYCGEAGGGHHETKEEALQCYTSYLLDTAAYRTMSNMKRPCQVCGEFTDGLVEVGHTAMYVLCPLHQTRAHVADLYGTVGEIYSSW